MDKYKYSALWCVLFVLTVSERREFDVEEGETTVYWDYTSAVTLVLYALCIA